jgi:hypothetical protein
MGFKHRNLLWFSVGGNWCRSKVENFRRKDHLEEFAEKVEMKTRQGTTGGRFPGKFCG